MKLLRLSRTGKNKKALTTSRESGLQQHEAIMNQIPSHSQMPTFVKNESNTKPVLFQPPKAEEMRPSRRAQLEADAKDFGLFMGVSLVMWLFITFFLASVIGG